MLILKNILFTVVVPGSVTVLVPYLLLAEGYTRLAFGPARYIGLPFVGLGIMLYGWCLWHFTVSGRGTPLPLDPTEALVVQGPYRWVRNPMYVAVVTTLLGEAVFFEAQALFVYAAGVFTAFHLFIVLYEEPTLRRQFGDAYRRYRNEVSRWFPWKGPFQER
jgi:protein-S-isoprenylcysteine O-methyltransferase Ste14